MTDVHLEQDNNNRFLWNLRINDLGRLDVFGFGWIKLCSFKNSCRLYVKTRVWVFVPPWMSFIQRFQKQTQRWIKHMMSLFQCWLFHRLPASWLLFARVLNTHTDQPAVAVNTWIMCIYAPFVCLCVLKSPASDTHTPPPVCTVITWHHPVRLLL